MKILHTADWHLGQRFITKERTEEHEFILNHILEIIQKEKTDILILAGDIFDTGNPSNTALKNYYGFLRKLLRTTCRHAVIIGGNHDSPSALEAPADLLNLLNVSVIGASKRLENGDIDYEREIIELRDEAGKTEAVIAAVPFLRDRDLKFGSSGETGKERVDALRLALADHYKQVGKLSEKYYSENIPIIATGHLFAAGTSVSAAEAEQDGENDIHIGNLGQVGAEIFPEVFSYVALGHIHKPQNVAGCEHIRYSGSPLPLSFSERNQQKYVVLLEYEGDKLKSIQHKELPILRKLIRFKGSLDEILLKIGEYTPEKEEAWAEVILTGNEEHPGIENLIQEAGHSKNLDFLKISRQRTIELQASEFTAVDLNELKPAAVFAQRCANLNEEEKAEMTDLFNELYTELIQEN